MIDVLQWKKHPKYKIFKDEMEQRGQVARPALLKQQVVQYIIGFRLIIEMELHMMSIVGRRFVTATYNLEADGFLAPFVAGIIAELEF